VVSSDRMRGNGSKLSEGRFRLDTRKHFFTKRMVKHWNRLPREVINAPSLSMLKRHLDNALNNLWSALFYSILFCSVLFCSVLFCSKFLIVNYNLGKKRSGVYTTFSSLRSLVPMASVTRPLLFSRKICRGRYIFIYSKFNHCKSLDLIILKKKQTNKTKAL